MYELMPNAIKLIRKYVVRRPRNPASQPPSRLPKMAPPERVTCVQALRRGSLRVGAAAEADADDGGDSDAAAEMDWLATWSAQGISQLALAEVPITGIAPRQMPIIVRLRRGGRMISRAGRAPDSPAFDCPSPESHF